MQKDEVVLSDVHLQVKNHQQHDYCISRFYYTEEINENSRKKSRFNLHTDDDLSSENKHTDDTVQQGLQSHENSLPGSQKLTTASKDTCTSDDGSKVEQDKDGDLKPKRRKRKLDYSSVITIAHKLETNLEKVGLQIWLASLYMSDFIVSKPEVFHGKRILDLGGGIGLSSVVASLYADHVICTDIGKDILNLAQHNLDMNSDKKCPNYKVMELDWFKNRFSSVEELNKEDNECTERLSEIESCDTIISADVVYDDDITDALFRTVHGLMSTNISTWYISLEKRYVFTLTDLDIACPSYQHFRDCLDQLEDMSNDDIVFTVSIIDEFQQCFNYTRTKELELWKVTANKQKNK